MTEPLLDIRGLVTAFDTAEGAAKLHADPDFLRQGEDQRECADDDDDEVVDVSFDVVVTVCGHAHETCPRFPAAARVIHVSFDDPPKMAREVASQGGDEEAQLDCYRRVRDEIRAFVAGLPESLRRDGCVQ